MARPAGGGATASPQKGSPTRHRPTRCLGRSTRGQEGPLADEQHGRFCDRRCHHPKQQGSALDGVSAQTGRSLTPRRNRRMPRTSAGLLSVGRHPLLRDPSRGPHPAITEAARQQRLAGRTRTVSAAPLGTPDFTTGVQAVAKSGVDDLRFEGTRTNNNDQQNGRTHAGLCGQRISDQNDACDASAPPPQWLQPTAE